MGLGLAVIVAFVTIFYFVLILGANASLPAPSVQSSDPWGPLVIGLSLAGLLALTHFIGW